MEKINQTLKRLAAYPEFQKRYDRMRTAIMNHPDVQAFLMKHKGKITNEMVEKSLSKLFEYAQQNKECQDCPSLGGCVNLMKGYQPELMIIRDTIEIQYERCPKKVMDDERKKNEALINSLYMAKDILTASFADLYDVDESKRIDAISKAGAFVVQYEPGKKQKGLYFYGKFGVGKSYLLGAIANELANRKIPSMLVYVPELFREMKSAIGDSTLNEKLERIKKEPILMLDDIGAESMSSWTRDEILGPILQFRMLEGLPTFFTSNFDFAGLENHLTYSQRGEVERMKARRIMERIKMLAEPVFLDGPNRRNEM
ncbi:primosomal protein DnaI [Bacillaceae bacterium Marseille-Q3522]|nr:primosomal protein DnaI [Bacillaceae bacterium Marseille-Q3522]